MSRTTADSLTLYECCRNSSRSEQERGYQELGQFLLRIARSRLQTKMHLAPLAEDCVQQALFTIWQKLEAGHGPDHPALFLTWSASIVIHKLLDELRRLQRRPAIDIEDSVDEDNAPALQIADAGAINPGDAAIQAEAAHELFAAIRDHPQLTSDVKTVLIDGYWHERNDDELADQIGKARATVRVLRHRGIKTLRDDPQLTIMWQGLSDSTAQTTRT